MGPRPQYIEAGAVWGETLQKYDVAHTHLEERAASCDASQQENTEQFILEYQQNGCASVLRLIDAEQDIACLNELQLPQYLNSEAGRLQISQMSLEDKNRLYLRLRPGEFVVGSKIFRSEQLRIEPQLALELTRICGRLKRGYSQADIGPVDERDPLKSFPLQSSPRLVKIGGQSVTVGATAVGVGAEYMDIGWAE